MCDYDKNTALVSLGESLERKKDLFSVFTFVFVFVYKQTKPIGGSLEEKSRVDFLFCVFCIYKQTTYLLCYSHKDCQFLIVRRQNILLAVIVVVVPLLLLCRCCCIYCVIMKADKTFGQNARLMFVRRHRSCSAPDLQIIMIIISYSILL